MVERPPEYVDLLLLSSPMLDNMVIMHLNVEKWSLDI